jgi:tRNA threonylcarbamoyladenosine biosynthesis protein TsaE
LTELVWESRGPDDTDALGAGLAELLNPGDIVLLRGDLGAGKTTLVRAVARRLGVTEPVTSPSFSLANRYQGRVPVAHLDAYRLTSVDDEELGLAMEVIGEDAIAFIEWPETLIHGLPDARLEVDLDHRGGDGRLVTFHTPDSNLESALHILLDDLRARHRDA